MIIVATLRSKLPRGYYAEPHVHSGSSAAIDVATFENEADGVAAPSNGNDHGGVATAVWAPSRPSLTVATDLPAQDNYEVLVFDEKRRSRLVAAVEIVSPANKDRGTHRAAFVAKCAALLRERVSVVIIDVVTTRSANLYAELLDHLGQADPALGPEPPPLYTAACRTTRHQDEWLLEAWTQPLALGAALPTMPLWLADDLAVPLELEASYEQSCGILGLP